jgi:hypothetical protein
VQQESIASPSDECYRCGYDLRGIADDHACPECGLLAQRSRRTTDELHNTRPRWLRSISRGVNLILLSLVLIFVWWLVTSLLLNHDTFASTWSIQIYLALSTTPAVLFIAGLWLLTRREGYAPADNADRHLRFWLRVAGLAPVLAVVLAILYVVLSFKLSYFLLNNPLSPLLWGFSILATFGSVPLPILLFLRLRSLAVRARSANLAEDCMIVGIGTSATWLYATIFADVTRYPQWFGLAPDWTINSGPAVFLLVLPVVAIIIFFCWSAYLLLRFAIAFHIAARNLRRQWLRDDRSDAAAQ